MPSDDEDLIVNLAEVDLPVEGEKPAEAKPPPVPGPSVTPSDGLQELERQIMAERADRGRLMQEAQQLQRERDEALQYAREAERQTGNNYEAWVQSQIDGMVNEMDSMAVQYEQAMNDGDFKSAAEINKRSNRVGGQIAIAEREKLALQQQREQKSKQQPQQRQQPRQQQQPQQQVPTDPVERAISGRTEPTKVFLRKHTDLIRSDGTLKKTAIDAHEKALDAGYTVDTQEYFGYIEQVLGANGGGGGENGAAVRQVPGYSAPVTRGPAPGGDSLSPGTFRMTPKMRRLAEEQGVTPAEWANNYIRLVKEGRMTPITSESDMERIPSPVRDALPVEPPPSHAEERAEHRVDERPAARLVDDGRERMRAGGASINPYEIDDIRARYCPTNGTGNKDRIAGEIDFQWNTYETYGKRDYAIEREHHNQGWQEVQHSDFPERFAPAGTEGPVIVKDMILMWRPMRLTVQARNEEIQRANHAMQVHRLKMAEAPEGQAPRTQPVLRSSREAIEIPD